MISSHQRKQFQSRNRMEVKEPVEDASLDASWSTGPSATRQDAHRPALGFVAGAGCSGTHPFLSLQLRKGERKVS